MLCQFITKQTSPWARLSAKTLQNNNDIIHYEVICISLRTRSVLCVSTSRRVTNAQKLPDSSLIFPEN